MGLLLSCVLGKSRRAGGTIPLHPHVVVNSWLCPIFGASECSATLQKAVIRCWGSQISIDSLSLLILSYSPCPGDNPDAPHVFLCCQNPFEEISEPFLKKSVSQMPLWEVPNMPPISPFEEISEPFLKKSVSQFTNSTVLPYPGSPYRSTNQPIIHAAHTPPWYLHLVLAWFQLLIPSCYEGIMRQA